MLCGCFNDVIAKWLAVTLPAYEICLFRFGFGALVLLPLYTGKETFQTNQLHVHVLRGVLLSGAMILYIYGLNHIAIHTATVIGFTHPIFVLIVARILLKEPVGWPIWVASCLVCIPILFLLKPDDFTYTPSGLTCLVAMFFFALLDVVNKKFMTHESICGMLFFSNLFACLCICFVAFYHFRPPTLSQLFALSILGIGSNLILYFLLKALQRVTLSFLAPFRYIEFVFSIFFGYTFFQEWPTYNHCISAAIIILATCFVAWHHGSTDKKG